MKYLTTKERISFTVAAFGRSGIYTLMSMFVLRFFTDAVGISSIAAGYIILAGRVFDAANDPLMGFIVDRTRSNWGKMRPYLLYSPIPIAITTILLFTAPDFQSMTAKVAYAAVTYILWGIAFTIQDVPFWGLSAVITPDENERTSFISTARLGSTAGGILPTLILPIFIADNAFGLTKGFFIGAVIFAVLGAALSSLAFFNTTERVEPVQKENCCECRNGNSQRRGNDVSPLRRSRQGGTRKSKRCHLRRSQSGAKDCHRRRNGDPRGSRCSCRCCGV